MSITSSISPSDLILIHLFVLDYITADNCTVDALTPIVSDVKNIISGAIVEVNALVGQPAEIILATVDGTAQITVAELAQLIGALITVSSISYLR